MQQARISVFLEPRVFWFPFHLWHTVLNPATVPFCPSLICDIIICYHFFKFCSFLCKLYSFSFLYYTLSFLAFIPSHLHIMTVPVSNPGFLCLIACPHVSLPFSVLALSPHFCAFTQSFLYSVLLFHFIPSLLLFFLSIVTLFLYSIFSMSYGPMFHPSSLIFHIVHVLHCKWFRNPYITNKCTILLLCIALLISLYMFRLNCYHHGANNYITKSLQQ